MRILKARFWAYSLVTVVSAQTAAILPDPVDDFCSISGHAILRAGDSLYIIGGSMRYINSSVDGPNHVLRSINVESSFRTPDSTSFVKVEPLPDLVPRVSNPSFWPVGDDGTQLELSFGKYEPGNVVGVYSQRKIPSQNLKWGYDTESKTWTEQETKQGWVSPENVDDSVRVASNQNVWVPGRKKGYQLSGLAFNETSTRVDGLWDTSGLVVYDQESNTWANETIPFDAHTGGGMVHISTANDDVLIHFGGWGVDNLIPRSMGDIYIYSTKQSEWYTHSIPSTKPLPPPRVGFCLSVVSAPDGSSHQIFILGGAEINTLETNTGPVALSVWVLSIPSFDWIQLPFKQEATSMNPQGRIDPVCATIGQHYILLYGGRNVKEFFDPPRCDNNGNAAFLLELNDVMWGSDYTPSGTPYKVSKEISRVVGGDERGGATKITPDDGFNNPALTSIMSLAVSIRTSTSVAAPPVGISDTDSSVDGTSVDGKKTSPGAIAGGVIAGVGVLGLLFGAAFFYRRRVLRNEAAAAQVYGGKPELGLPSPTTQDWTKHRAELDNKLVYFHELSTKSEQMEPAELEGKRHSARGPAHELP